MPLPGPAAKLSRTPTRVRSAPPGLGADGEAVLREVGLEPEEVSALAASGVVQLPR